MEKNIMFSILTVAIFCAALINDSDAKSFNNEIGPFGHLETRDELIEGDGGRDDPSTWEVMGDGEESRQQLLAITGAELMRFLMQQQARARKMSTLGMGTIGNKYENSALSFNSPPAGISGARNKKRQILYRQCFFNPISCF